MEPSTTSTNPPNPSDDHKSTPPDPTPNSPAAADPEHPQFSAYEFPSSYQPAAAPARPSPVATETTQPASPIAPSAQPPAPEATPPHDAQTPPTNELSKEIDSVTTEAAPAKSAALRQNLGALPVKQLSQPSVVTYTPEPLRSETTAAPPPTSAKATTTTAVLSVPVAKLKSYLPKRFVNETGQINKQQLKASTRPLLSTFLIGAIIYGVFNSQLILGQIQYLVSPGANAEAPATVNDTQPIGNQPEIIIPKINLRVPVVYDVTTFDEAAVQAALERGVVHYGTTALPGQRGNNVIVGHSSNNWWAGGKYKFAFVLLNKLEPGDSFYLNFNGQRYTYEVTGKKIVEANDINVLNQNVTVPMVTLITCDPPGTSWKRLIVQAQQVDPDPAQTMSAASADQSSASDSPLPGYGESFWDKIKELFR